jgi:hypothetical protein
MLSAGGSDEVALIGAAIAATERARARSPGAATNGGAPRARWIEAGRREALRG